MSFYPELDQLNFDQLKSKWFSEPLKDSKYAVLYYDEIASILVQKFDQEGIPFLVEQLDSADLDQLASIVGFSPLPVRLIETYLSHSSPLIISRAIDQLAEKHKIEFIDDMLKFYKHQDPIVRSSALRAITSQISSDKAIPLLLDALHDPSPIVRQSALDELDELEVWEAKTDISKLLNDPDKDVRQAAKTALSNLSSV